jgi:hypothetical protein
MTSANRTAIRARNKCHELRVSSLLRHPQESDRAPPLRAVAVTTAIQAWIAIVGGLATAMLGILKYFSYQTRRDRKARVGEAFASCVDGLSSKDETQQFAAAILLRRFFREDAEQGDRSLPYRQEAIGVIAALLRALEPGPLQKLLADGLAYAPSLRGADLQQCRLNGAYFGERPDRDAVDLSEADLFKADLTRASLKEA